METHVVVREAIREYNEDFVIRAWVSLLVGIATTILTFAIIALVSLILFHSSHWLIVAWLVFISFMAASIWAIRRGQDPLSEVSPLTDADAAAIAAAWTVSGMALSPRHAIAGYASVIMHGPKCLMESLSLWKARIPEDNGMIMDATDVLNKIHADGSVPVSSISSPRVAVMLHRIGLAKTQRRGSKSVSLIFTAKASDRVTGA